MRCDSRLFDKILRWRGCQFVGDKGGHRKYLAPNGDMVITVCPGRPTPVKTEAIKNAANSLGCTPRELLATRKKDTK